MVSRSQVLTSDGFLSGTRNFNRSLVDMVFNIGTKSGAVFLPTYMVFILLFILIDLPFLSGVLPIKGYIFYVISYGRLRILKSCGGCIFILAGKMVSDTFLW